MILCNIIIMQSVIVFLRTNRNSLLNIAISNDLRSLQITIFPFENNDHAIRSLELIDL